MFSWPAHSPLGKSHHGLIQAAQQQRTSPLGENKTFSNLPLYNSITSQSFFVKRWVKHSGSIVEDVTPTFRCAGEGSLTISHFSLPGYVGEDTHRAGSPAVITFICLTQLWGQCEHPSWCCVTPAPVPSDIPCCVSLPLQAVPQGLFILEHVKMEKTLAGRVI